MSKTLIFPVLAVALVSLTARAESYTCQGQDLKISLGRSVQTSPIIYPEASTLTVNCKGQNALILVTSSPIAPSLFNGGSSSDTGTSMWSLASNFVSFAQGFFKAQENQHENNVQKEYLAILLLAKTNNLPVTISYDTKSGLNYTDGQHTILGVSIE